MASQINALFEPLLIGKVRLKNRVALAPTYVGMGDQRGNVTDQALCYYFARAIGGVGLVIVEITGVTGRYAFSPGYGLGIGSDSHIPGMRDLAQVIHWGGAKAFLQLLPGQGAQALWSQEKRPLVAPSDVPALISGEDLPGAIKGLKDNKPDRPRSLTSEEIGHLKISVGKAANRAKRAGFDGIELHGAHGYLLSQFLLRTSIAGMTNTEVLRRNAGNSLWILFGESRRMSGRISRSAIVSARGKGFRGDSICRNPFRWGGLWEKQEQTIFR